MSEDAIASQSQHYMVGDIQGCLTPLENLLEHVGFNPNKDQLWCVGDLVNRGPQSLETLRRIKHLGQAAKVVLGNHDLHLLAAHAQVKPLKPKDAPFLQPILESKDVDELMDWLRQQPLVYVDHRIKAVMVHAGLPHIWTLKESLEYAHEVEEVLQSNQFVKLLDKMYGNSPSRWDNQLKDHKRLRLIINYLTRMRFISPEGELEFDSKESPFDAPKGFAPWFSYPTRSQPYPIIFGHWAALMGQTHRSDRLGLDTGCVWGHHLTLYHFESKQYYRASPSGEVAL